MKNTGFDAYDKYVSGKKSLRISDETAKTVCDTVVSLTKILVPVIFFAALGALVSTEEETKKIKRD